MFGRGPAGLRPTAELMARPHVHHDHVASHLEGTVTSICECSLADDSKTWSWSITFTCSKPSERGSTTGLGILHEHGEPALDVPQGAFGKLHESKALLYPVELTSPPILPLPASIRSCSGGGAARGGRGAAPRDRLLRAVSQFGVEPHEALHRTKPSAKLNG